LRGLDPTAVKLLITFTCILCISKLCTQPTQPYKFNKPSGPLIIYDIVLQVSDMSDEKITSSPSELEPLTDVTDITSNDNASPSAKLTVSFDTDHQPEGGGDVRPRGYSQNRQSSILEESWRRRDSSTRIMDANKFISFHNIVYQVPVKKWFREKSKKVVLHGVRYTVHMWSTVCVIVMCTIVMGS